MNERLYGFIAIIFTVLVWGFSYISSKIALAYFTPILLTFVRFVIAGIIYWILAMFFSKGEKINKRNHFFILFLSGFFGIALYYTFENMGINMLGASNAALVLAAIPIISYIFSLVIGERKLDLSGILGCLISFLGVYLISQQDLNLGAGSVAGYVVMLFAALFWVLYNFSIRSLYSEYSKLTLLKWQVLLGNIMLLPFAVSDVKMLINVSIYAWVHVLFLAIICSAVAVFLYMYALDKLDVMTTTLFVNFMPFITVFFGFILLGETLSPIQLVGGALVIIAVFLTK